MNRTPASVALILMMTALFMGDDIKASTENSKVGVEEATRETIEQLELEFNQAILGRDEAALNRLLSDDCTTGGNEALTKSEYINQILTNAPPKMQTLDSISVTIYGNTAVVTGLANAEWVSPAGAWSDTLRRVHVWVHGENGWQVVFLQSTVVKPNPSGDGC